MTLENAKKKAAELEGCKGFCFKGSDPKEGEKVEVLFKNKFDTKQESNPWTTYEVRQDAIKLKLTGLKGITDDQVEVMLAPLCRTGCFIEKLQFEDCGSTLGPLGASSK